MTRLDSTRLDSTRIYLAYLRRCKLLGGVVGYGVELDGYFLYIRPLHLTLRASTCIHALAIFMPALGLTHALATFARPLHVHIISCVLKHAGPVD